MTFLQTITNYQITASRANCETTLVNRKFFVGNKAVIENSKLLLRSTYFQLTSNLHHIKYNKFINKDIEKMKTIRNTLVNEYFSATYSTSINCFSQ